VVGAEAGSYFSLDPEYTIKNGKLDRLTEVRLVRGARMLLWGEWSTRFTALPKAKGGEYCNLSEHVNVNTASAAQIQAFLEALYVDPGTLAGSDARTKQGYINGYADRAEEVAQYLAPPDAVREAYDSKSLKAALAELDFADTYGEKLLSPISEYYRIFLVTEVAGVRSRLEAMLHVPRDPATRFAKGTAQVLWVSLN
jgi:hypothetical protein